LGDQAVARSARDSAPLDLARAYEPAHGRLQLPPRTSDARDELGATHATIEADASILHPLLVLGQRSQHQRIEVRPAQLDDRMTRGLEQLGDRDRAQGRRSGSEQIDQVTERGVGVGS
jgi:hypothetical protein